MFRVLRAFLSAWLIIRVRGAALEWGWESEIGKWAKEVERNYIDSVAEGKDYGCKGTNDLHDFEHHMSILITRGYRGNKDDKDEMKKKFNWRMINCQRLRIDLQQLVSFYLLSDVFCVNGRN